MQKIHFLIFRSELQLYCAHFSKYILYTKGGIDKKNATIIQEITLQINKKRFHFIIDQHFYSIFNFFCFIFISKKVLNKAFKQFLLTFTDHKQSYYLPFKWYRLFRTVLKIKTMLFTQLNDSSGNEKKEVQTQPCAISTVWLPAQFILKRQWENKQLLLCSLLRISVDPVPWVHPVIKCNL